MSNTARPINVIAAEIRADWKNVYFGAKPYLHAMDTLKSINDDYLYDTGRSVVLYFLTNASTWRGTVAKATKVELNKMLKN